MRSRDVPEADLASHDLPAGVDVHGVGPERASTEGQPGSAPAHVPARLLPWLAAVFVAVGAVWLGASRSDFRRASTAQMDADSPLRDVVESAYRQGRHALLQPDHGSLLRALEHFRTALDADAGYAPAWAGLSSTYLRLSTWAALPPQEGYPRARQAAERALALDPDLAEAHANLASIADLYDWDTDSAGAHFERALGAATAAPDSVHVLHRYSAYLRNLGRFDDALEVARKAAEVDPLAPLPRLAEGGIHYVAGRYEEAIAVYRMLLAADPDETVAHKFIALAASMSGSYATGLQALERYDPEARFMDTHAIRAYIRARQGDSEAARNALVILDRRFGAEADRDFYKALVMMGLEEHDAALDLLEASLRRPTAHLRVLGTDPHFDPLRSDPRFHAILGALDLHTEPRRPIEP